MSDYLPTSAQGYPKPLQALWLKRDGAAQCVRCGQFPQENGNWCWDCSTKARAGVFPWTAPPEPIGGPTNPEARP